jgi:hypothetical protein
MWGQDPRGNITGQITDSTGAVIPKVSVSVANLDTNVTQVVLSNEQGRYQALFLPVGRYRVTAELTGFKTWSRPSIDVRIGDRLDVLPP